MRQTSASRDRALVARDCRHLLSHVRFNFILVRRPNSTLTQVRKRKRLFLHVDKIEVCVISQKVCDIFCKHASRTATDAPGALRFAVSENQLRQRIAGTEWATGHPMSRSASRTGQERLAAVVPPPP